MQFYLFEALPFPEAELRAIIPTHVDRWTLIGQTQSVAWQWVMMQDHRFYFERDVWICDGYVLQEIWLFGSSVLPLLQELALTSFCTPTAVLCPENSIDIYSLLWTFFLHPGATHVPYIDHALATV